MVGKTELRQINDELDRSMIVRVVPVHVTLSISNVELIALMVGRQSAGLGKIFASDEFRRRFFAENAELIALEAQKLQEGIK